MEFLVVDLPTYGEFVQGDIIAMRPDGWEWGSEEYQDQLFRIVRVPDADVGDIAAEPLTGIDVNGNPEIVGPSKFRVSGVAIQERQIVRQLPNGNWATSIRLVRTVIPTTVTHPDKPRRTGPRVSNDRPRGRV